MSVSFAVGANDVRWTQGGAGAVGTGAFSLYALINLAVGNNNGGFVAGYATNTLVRGIGSSGLHLYGANDFSPSGFGTLTQGVWYEVMVTKSSASALWRMHLRLVNPGGTPGAWSHGTAAGGSAQGNGSAITNFRIGNVGIAQANGLIGAWAAWTSELADATIDLIDGTGLASVNAQAPQEMVALDGWAGTSGDVVLVGTCSRSAVTGTASIGANPNGFGFTIGGGGSNVTIVDLASGMRLGGGSDSAALGVVTGDLPSGLRLGGAGEAVLFGVAAQDAAGRLLTRSADGSGVVSGISSADLPNGLRLRSGFDSGAGTGLTVVDAPGGLRFGSADGLGVVTGVSFVDTGSGIRLGSPLAGFQSGLVVLDAPGGIQLRSGASSVVIAAGSVTIFDLPAGLRFRSGATSAGDVVPTTPPVVPIIVVVPKFRALAPVSRVGIVVHVNEVRA